MKSSLMLSALGFLLVTTLLFVTLGNILSADAAGQTSASNCAVTWHETAYFQGEALNAVEAIAANNVWVAGDGDLHHWNGQTWETMRNPIGQPITQLASLPDGQLWAANQSTVMHRDGATWEKVGGPNDLGGSDLAVLAPDDIWATTINGVRHWDGRQWTYIQITELQTETNFLHITALAPDKIWVVGYYGHAKVAVGYVWDGKQWTLGPYSGSADSAFLSVSASAPDNVWVIGVYGYAMAQMFDGTHWNEVDPPAYLFSDIKALAPDDVYAVGDGVVHWDGREWTMFLYPTGLRAISGVSPTDLWAVGGATVMHGTLPCAEPLTPTPAPPTVTPTGYTCPVTPPVLIAPKDEATFDKTRIRLAWQEQTCAQRYNLALGEKPIRGKKILRENVTATHYRTPELEAGKTYYWHVRACNVRCSHWSEWRSFTIKP